jgi:hypothetical protein
MACILTTFYESLFLKIQEKGALFLKTMFSCGCQESTKPGLKRNHHGKKPTKFNLLLAFFTFYI